MQLNEILEEHSIKGISQKTKISEENLQNLFNANFVALKKVKTFGFISIVEREFKADLNALRQEALEYYRQHQEHNGFSATLSVIEEKKKKSLPFVLIVLAILGYASWYFFTQFDKKHLSKMIPFTQSQQLEAISMPKVENKQENLVIESSGETMVVEDTNIDVWVEEDTLEDVEPKNENTIKER
jgi:hypothetical protein